MRLALSLLPLFVLLASPVWAEEKPAWVDPPAKSATGAEARKTDDAAKPAMREAQPDSQASSQDPASRTAENRTRRTSRNPGRLSASSARTPAMNTHKPTAPGEVETGEPRMAAWSGTARRMTADYLAAVSSNDGLLGSASRFYGDRVRFHGRAMTRAALAAEKARFARRWPERRYAPRGEQRMACDAASATCTVTTAFEFRAANPARSARSTGVGELTLTVGFAADRPVILAETSRVLRRGAAAVSAVDRPGNGA